MPNMKLNKKTSYEKQTVSLDDLSNKIVSIANEYKEDPEKLVDFLAFRSKFYNYSTGNSILIAEQNPGASFCSSFNGFKEMGYNILKGSKGYKIFVPTPVIMYREDTEHDWKYLNELSASDKKIVQQKIKDGLYLSRKRLSFKVGTTFDITQTDCPVEDYPKLLSVGYADKDYNKVYNGIKSFISTEFECPVNEQKLNSLTLRGAFNPLQNKIVINSVLDDSEKLSTLIHEVGHAILHNDVSEKKTTAQKEFEADAFAIMVESKCGIEITDLRRKHISDSFKNIDFENNISTEDAFGANGKGKLTIKTVLDNVANIYAEYIPMIENCIEEELNKDIDKNKNNPDKDTLYWCVGNEDNGKYRCFYLSEFYTVEGDICEYNTAEEAKKHFSKRIDMTSKKTEELTDELLLKQYGISLNNISKTEKEQALVPPYVRIRYSENDDLRKGDCFSIKEAQTLFAKKDRERAQLNLKSDEPYYEKTSFQIVLDEDNNVYNGRQDFGDGEGGLINHITNYAQNEIMYMAESGFYSDDQANLMQKETYSLIKDLWNAVDYETLKDVEDNSVASALLEKIEKRNAFYNEYGYAEETPRDLIKESSKEKNPILEYCTNIKNLGEDFEQQL